MAPETELKGGLDLRLRKTILKGGDRGPAITLGDPRSSLLIRQLREGEMPPSGKSVPEEKIRLVEQWIAEGAATAGPEPSQLAPGEVYITAEERAFWSFRPISKPNIAAQQGFKNTHRHRRLDTHSSASETP